MKIRGIQKEKKKNEIDIYKNKSIILKECQEICLKKY